jgi:hypothetical protein
MEHRKGPHDEWQYGDRTPAEVRGTLLALTLEFVLAARELVGVHRIALLGSLTTNKDRPKDADVLVTIDTETPVEELARIGRRFQGRAQGINSTADVFLVDLDGRYLGRVCHYRECHPRAGCRARHCGARPHVTDDLDVVSLDHPLILEPPLILHPSVIAAGEVPADVAALLLARLPTRGTTEAIRTRIDAPAL